ncbi:MAG: 4-aminobutyrate--2-oxoglutarate transaminase [Clostridia bacterium]|nr:4-aminobutyrate--2-oxoglutarate transaminase [Clostridia bacterium]NCC44043.1 4-aminobutyrate--2-oxoglutarate transaminase [Clostridia bacterium]
MENLREALPEIITDTLPGPKAKEMIERRSKVVPNAIRCGYPCVMERAAGAIIEDVDGNRFLDWVGGVGVLNVGHTHPELVEAVKKQSEKYFHGMFNIVTHEGYVELAEKLAALTPVKGDEKKVMFANSGAEADENAVKIAKSYTKRPNIIVFSGAFHGRTMLTMAMTAKKAYAVGMGPFPDGVYRAQYPYLYRKPEGMTDEAYLDECVESVKMVFENASPAEYVAAIVLEPLQGEGGFIPAPIEFVKALRKICDENGIMLVADEVQSGFCRTGKLFASEYWKEAGCEPDILATAKSIAGGVPLSAVIARTEIMDGVTPGTIGGTYGGNALACAAGIKVLEVIEKEHLVARSNEMGAKCFEKFNEWKEKYEVVGDVRGLGAMIGVEFVKDKETKEPNAALVSAVVAECAQNGLLVENAGIFGNVIRFLAPLVMTDAQLEKGFEIFENAIKKCM